MVRMRIMIAMVLVAAASTEEFVSDVMDDDIGDGDSDHGVPNIANVVDIKILDMLNAKIPSDVEVSRIDDNENSDEVNFLIASPNITKVDPTVKDYPKELYLPDEDTIDNLIDDTLVSDDIIDVIKNFISERDPMLQVLHFLYCHTKARLRPRLGRLYYRF